MRLVICKTKDDLEAIFVHQNGKSEYIVVAYINFYVVLTVNKHIAVFIVYKKY